MGENAERVQEYLRGTLSEALDADWTTEYDVNGTPVDAAGAGEKRLVLVELEWRRADPADNTAKIFRGVSEGGVEDDVYLFQVFTRYYDLSDGGVSSKRKNAEFVGNVAAEAIDRLRYEPLCLDVAPPKRGGELPDGWRSGVEEVAEEVDRVLRN